MVRVLRRSKGKKRYIHNIKLGWETEPPSSGSTTLHAVIIQTIYRTLLGNFRLRCNRGIARTLIICKKRGPLNLTSSPLMEPCIFTSLNRGRPQPYTLRSAQIFRSGFTFEACWNTVLMLRTSRSILRNTSIYGAFACLY